MRIPSSRVEARVVASIVVVFLALGGTGILLVASPLTLSAPKTDFAPNTPIKAAEVNSSLSNLHGNDAAINARLFWEPVTGGINYAGGWVGINSTNNLGGPGRLEIGEPGVLIVNGSSQPGVSWRNSGSAANRFSLFTMSGAGATLNLGYYSDAGVYLGSAITVKRADGYVGIGPVTDPIYPLQVRKAAYGDIALFTDGSKGVDLATLTTCGGVIGWNGTAYNDLDIRTTSTIGGGLYLNTAGNAGIGCANPAAALVVKTGVFADVFLGTSILNGRAGLRIYSNQGYAVSFVGNNYFDGIAVKRVHAGAGGAFNVDTSSAATGGDIFFVNWDNGAADSVVAENRRMTIKRDGSVSIACLTGAGPVYSNGTYLTNTNPSSRDYKRDIAAVELHPERLLLLEPKSFAWKSDGKADVGLVAEEVREVLPELYRDDGRTIGYDISKLPVYLIALAKLQQARIVELEARQAETAAAMRAEIAALEARLAALEGRIP